VEEVLVVVLQVFFELGIQLLGAPGIDFSISSSDKHERGCGWVVLHTFLGGLAGWVSTLIFPKLLLTHVALRIANLVIAPLVAGGLSYWAADWMRKKADTWTPFWHGFAFALVFGLARFAFGER
jgi:hypothetical protein